MDKQTIINSLTPLVGPLLTALWKKIQPSVPHWVMPILATALGTLFNYLTSYIATHDTANIWIAAGLGLAGVGIREIKDQLTPDHDLLPPAAAPVTPVTPPTPPTP